MQHNGLKKEEIYELILGFLTYSNKPLNFAFKIKTTILEKRFMIPAYLYVNKVNKDSKEMNLTKINEGLDLAFKGTEESTFNLVTFDLAYTKSSLRVCVDEIPAPKTKTKEKE